jgi:hypothetical protein
MARSFVAVQLFQWTGCYVLLGAVPFITLRFFAPEDFLFSRVGGTEQKPLLAVDVGMWFPITMFVAAFITVVVGLFFATVQAVWRYFGLIPVPWIRTFVAVFGVCGILAGVILVYLSVVGDRVATTVPYILVCVSLGIGLATGATYYRDE